MENALLVVILDTECNGSMTFLPDKTQVELEDENGKITTAQAASRRPALTENSLWTKQPYFQPKFDCGQYHLPGKSIIPCQDDKSKSPHRRP
jgi:hypothetical protein